MPRQLQPCGTTAAYRRHLNHDEEPCDPCKAANRDARRDQREREPKSLADALALAALRGLQMPAGPTAPSAKADLMLAARMPSTRQSRAHSILDPTKLPALVRELRETWKALGELGAEDDGEDEFTRALNARADRLAYEGGGA